MKKYVEFIEIHDTGKTKVVHVPQHSERYRGRADRLVRTLAAVHVPAFASHGFQRRMS